MKMVKPIVSPWEILRDEAEARNIEWDDFCVSLECQGAGHPNDSDLALMCEFFGDLTPQFFHNLFTNYQRKLAKRML